MQLEVNCSCSNETLAQKQTKEKAKSIWRPSWMEKKGGKIFHINIQMIFLEKLEILAVLGSF